MNHVLKTFANNFLPPIVQRGLLTIGGRRSKWTGNYNDWSSAVAASSGYDSGVILDRVRKSASAVRDGKALWERDSTCFYHEEYNWQLLGCLMTAACRSGGALNVLDFGGSLGSTYMQHRKLLAGLPVCSWNVVEQSHIVACGRAEFETDLLRFFSTIEECFDTRPVNVVLFSSVLQYLEEPYELLEEIMKRAPAAIIIDRTPITNNGERITVQHVPKVIYRASYPCRFLDKSKLEKILNNKTRHLTPWFSSPVDPVEFRGVMSVCN
jgi:putative methyltransferase (TIGR04325 family)